MSSSTSTASPRNEYVLVNSIYALTKHEQNRGEISRDKGVLQSLSLFLGSSNNDVIRIALQALQNLTEGSTSARRRLGRDAALMACLEEVVHINHDDQVVSLARLVRGRIHAAAAPDSGVGSGGGVRVASAFAATSPGRVKAQNKYTRTLDQAAARGVPSTLGSSVSRSGSSSNLSGSPSIRPLSAMQQHQHRFQQQRSSSSSIGGGGGGNIVGQKPSTPLSSAGSSQHSFFTANARKARVVTLQLVHPGSFAFGDVSEQFNSVLLSTHGVVSFTFDQVAARLTLRVLLDVAIDAVLQKLVDVQVHTTAEDGRRVEWGGEVVLRQVVRSGQQEVLLETVRCSRPGRAGKQAHMQVDKGDSDSEDGSESGEDNDDDDDDDNGEEDAYAVAGEPDYLDEDEAYNDEADNSRSVVAGRGAAHGQEEDGNRQSWLGALGGVFKSLW
ncbi:Armadillo repeat-containing protein 1 [Sorochytrium milnesiophthora]